MVSSQLLDGEILKYVDSKITAGISRPVCVKELHALPAIENQAGKGIKGQNSVNASMSRLHYAGLVHMVPFKATKWPQVRLAIASKKGTVEGKVIPRKRKESNGHTSVVTIAILGKPTTLAEARQVYQDLKVFFGA